MTGALLVPADHQRAAQQLRGLRQRDVQHHAQRGQPGASQWGSIPTLGNVLGEVGTEDDRADKSYGGNIAIIKNVAGF